MYFKAEKPAGHRIDRLFAEGRLVTREDVYSVAYVTAQGVPLRFGKNRQNLDICAIEAMRALFAKTGSVTPSTAQTFFEI